MAKGDTGKTKGSFIKGFASFFSSFTFLRRNRGLIKFFIIPFFINLVILITVFYFSFTRADAALSGLLTGSAWYFTVLRILIKPVLFVLLGIVTVLIYSIAGIIITAPFNDVISLRVERAVTGASFDEKFSILVLVKDIFRIAAGILILLLITVLLNIAILLLNLIPVVGNLAYTILSFLMASFFIGYQFFDFPLERRRLGFSRKFWIAWQHKRLVTGLGAAFLLVSYVPVIGFLGINIATIGGTRLFIDYMQQDIKE